MEAAEASQALLPQRFATMFPFVQARSKRGRCAGPGAVEGAHEGESSAAAAATGGASEESSQVGGSDKCSKVSTAGPLVCLLSVECCALHLAGDCCLVIAF